MLTTADILIDPEHMYVSKDPLSKHEVQHDIDILMHAMTHGYGGWQFITESQRKQFSSAIMRIRKKANRHASKGAINLCTAIDDALTIIPDSHLRARIDIAASCANRRKQFIRQPSVGNNIAADHTLPWKLIYRKMGTYRVPVLGISSLPNYNSNAWQGFEGALLSLAKEPIIIIDLRGNRGGSDTAMQRLRLLLTGHYPPKQIKRHKRLNPETIAIALNDIYLDIQYTKEKNEPIPSWLTQDKHELEIRFQHAIDKKTSGTRIIDYSTDKRFSSKRLHHHQPHIFFLTDSKCMSSCEGGLEMFTDYPHATRIGQNTGGAIHFGNVGTLMLPNSAIMITLATDYWEFIDGRQLERIGYAPDIPVPPGQDALDIAFKLALKKRTPVRPL